VKKEEFYEILGSIDEDYVNQARCLPRKARRFRAAAVCAAAVVMLALLGLRRPATPVPPVSTEETAFSQRYIYRIDEGPFAPYLGGKVIAKDRIGEKLLDVTLTAGWQGPEGQWFSTEHLRGQIYAIRDIPAETAVALKFLDQGEAITTTHYYVILNPEADLSPVAEYVIREDVSADPGEE